MGFNCGIIGLPNVGKSTIFNALSGVGAPMANYPFCTIKRNIGIVPVPDNRLQRLGKLLNKPNPIPTRIEFIDVAGLVKGASKGEGRGNRFLGDIRGVDAVVHVVRCFESEDIIHVMGNVDPLRDIEIINTELILADIQVLDRALEKSEKNAKSGDKVALKRIALIKEIVEYLDKGNLLKTMEMNDDQQDLIKELGLITSKPVLYLANTGEDEPDPGYLEDIRAFAHHNSSVFLSICGNIEEEISGLAPEERMEYLSEMGIKKSGLYRLVEVSHRLLDLVTFYTNTTDLQAWTVKTGTPALKAAGKIHTDFEKGFIRAEVTGFDQLMEAGSEQGARTRGWLRSEGKEYIICDGDVVHFLFNV